MKKVFDGQSADGNSLTIEPDVNKALVILTNNLGGGTVTVEALAPDGEWIPVEGGTITAKGLFVIDAVKGVTYRLNLSGSTSPNLNGWLGVPSL